MQHYFERQTQSVRTIAVVKAEPPAKKTHSLELKGKHNCDRGKIGLIALH